MYKVFSDFVVRNFISGKVISHLVVVSVSVVISSVRVVNQLEQWTLASREENDAHTEKEVKYHGCK